MASDQHKQIVGEGISGSQEKQELPEIAALLRAFRKRTETLRLPDLAAMPRELQSIMDELEHLTGHWNPVEFYTPSVENREQEQKRFMESRERGERVEPHFSYPVAEATDPAPARAALLELDRRVRAFGPSDETSRITRVALHFKIKDDLATCDILDGIRGKDESLIKHGLETKYPGTDPILIEQAKAQYREECINRPAKGRLHEDEIKALKEMKLDTTDQKRAFEWALERCGILRGPTCPDGFNVVVDPNVTSIDVRDKCTGGPTVFVPAKRDLRDMDALDMCSLLGHEINKHARHAMNGRRLFRIGGAMLRTDDETLYEGLGMEGENEFLMEYVGKNECPELSMYVLAIALAEQGKSFSEIVDDQEEKWLHICGKIPADQPLPETLNANVREDALKRAYRVAYRVMRGHTDMSNSAAFAMPKDLAYFRGTQLQQKLRDLKLGHLSEAAIMSTDALQLVSRFDVKESDLPYPSVDVAGEYLKILQESDEYLEILWGNRNKR